MKKVAKLVAVSIMTRVLVDKDATDEEIMKIARPQLVRNLEEDGLLDHIESIEKDTEMPFGSARFDKYYQPDFKDADVRNTITYIHVFADKKIAKAAFPKAKINTYYGGDSKELQFVDEQFKKKLNLK